MTMKNNSVGDTPSKVGDDTGSEDKDKSVDKKSDMVSYETYQRTLDQLKKTESSNRNLSDRLSELEKKEHALEEQKLIQAGEYKKLVELREQQIEDLRSKIGEITNERDTDRKTLQDTYKAQSFYQKLPGKIKRSEYLSFVDLDSIAVNPETGLPDEKSVETAVEGFMTNYADLVDTSHIKSLPGKPANPDNYRSSLSADSFKGMSLKEKKQNLPEFVREQKRKLGLI